MTSYVSNYILCGISGEYGETGDYMKRVSKIIIVVCVIVMTVCLFNIIRIMLQYKNEKKDYNKLSESYVEENQSKGIIYKEVIVKTENGTEEHKIVEVENSSPAGENKDSDNKKVPEPFDNIKVDYNGLYKKNDDYVGWIHIDNGVNYPVVQGNTNNEYLHLNFEKKENSCGSIMMSVLNNGDFSDRVTILYGHNMKNGAMFGINQKYKKEDYAREHPYVFIHLKDRYLVYKVCTSVIAKEDSTIFAPKTDNDKDFKDYIKQIKKNAYYCIEDINTEDKLLLMSTCTGQTGGDDRLIVTAKYVGFVLY